MMDDGWETIALRLGMATVIGAILGFEREWRGHDAGIRTHALVALSSAMTIMSAILLAEEIWDHGGTAIRSAWCRAWRRRSASSLAGSYSSAPATSAT
jgi:uncharacterized membrane protein YhiD involved in acid resistance